MTPLILLVVATLLMLYAAYELAPRAPQADLDARAARRGAPVLPAPLSPGPGILAGRGHRQAADNTGSLTVGEGDSLSAASALPSALPLVPPWLTRLRQSWRANRLWFCVLALGLALVGQYSLSPFWGPPSTGDTTAGLRWYGLAILVLLPALHGSYVNRSLVRRGDRSIANPTLWARIAGLASLAVGLNVWSIIVLRADWLSLLGLALWVGSVGTLVFAFSVAPRDQTSGREDWTDDQQAFAWRLPRAVEVGAVLAIMAAAAAMRLWRLDDFATGMHGDEGEAGVDALKILNGGLVSPFTAGWFNQANMYYWSISLCMKLLGTGLFGLRSFAVLCGLITVLCVYLIAREMFGQRAAILAGCFIAFQSADVIFSRQEYSNVTTPTFMTVAFYFLLRGLRTRRQLHFVLGGFTAGLSLYFFAGGRLVAPVAVALFVYLAVRHRAFLPRYWTHVAAFLLALFIVSSPFAAYFLIDHPIPSNVYPNDRFIWLHYSDLAQQYNAMGWPAILWGQLTRTLAILTHTVDTSAITTIDYPVARPLEAVLIVLGLAWAVWRWGDTRFALLSIWFWASIIGGGVLTMGPPNLPRILGMLPALALIIACLLDHLVVQVTIAAPKAGSLLRYGATGARVGRWLGPSIAGAVVLVSGLQNWRMLTSHALDSYQNVYVTAQAAYVHERGLGYRYYDMASPVFYWIHGDNHFINPKADGIDVANVTDYLPIIDNGSLGEKDTVFLVWWPMYGSLPVLQAYYPEGTKETVPLADAAHPAQALIVYTITHRQIDRRRVVRVRYVPASGTAVDRASSAIGLTDAVGLPPGLRYPVRATWDGALVAPASGAYRFELGAPVGAHLMIDGRDVFPGGTPAVGSGVASVVLTHGPHTVHLTAIAPSPRARVRLRWATGANPLAPIAPRYLWDNHVSGPSVAGPGASIPGS